MQIAEFSKDADGQVRDIVMIVNESLSYGCGEMRQMVWFADITIENQPMVVSNWTVPEASGNFCSRLGRFGAHAANEDMGPPSIQEAGLHQLLLRRRARPRYARPVPAEGGRLFLPAITEATTRRCGELGKGALRHAIIMTNNVEVDDRGYIYAADRFNTGLHILELTGEARAIAGLPPNCDACTQRPCIAPARATAGLDPALLLRSLMLTGVLNARVKPAHDAASGYARTCSPPGIDGAVDGVGLAFAADGAQRLVRPRQAGRCACTSPPADICRWR